MLANIDNYWGFPFSITGSELGDTILFTALILWSLYWKGRALWRASKNDSKKWFVALLVINTLGILEILYIYVFSKRKQ